MAGELAAAIAVSVPGGHAAVRRSAGLPRHCDRMSTVGMPTLFPPACSEVVKLDHAEML